MCKPRKISKFLIKNDKMSVNRPNLRVNKKGRTFECDLMVEYEAPKLLFADYLYNLLGVVNDMLRSIV